MVFGRGVWFSIVGDLGNYNEEFTEVRIESDIRDP